MAAGSFRFDRFVLEPGDRRLMSGDGPVELNARYFDALALLVREQGKLVSKDRFLDEVWRGVPVTDEALTQCIKTLRRQLGDEAARPRFIETVPKHGYRFIAPVEPIADGGQAAGTSPRDWWREFLVPGLAGTIGGGVAGLIGGLFYGFAGASQPLEPGPGAFSILLVLVVLTIVVGLIGAAGVAFGIAGASVVSRQPWQWSMIGGAAGGLVVGAIVKLLGVDAFNLLFGQSPGDVTGAPEGALLGGAVGLGVWLANLGRGRLSLRLGVAGAALTGAAAGILIPVLGGRLMGGSLDLVASRFPQSRLRLDQLSGLAGEDGFGLVSQMVTGALEAGLFCGCVAGAMIIARRRMVAEEGLEPPTRGL